MARHEAPQWTRVWLKGERPVKEAGAFSAEWISDKTDKLMQPLRILTRFFQKMLGCVFFLLGCVVCDGVEFAEPPAETGISSLYLRSTWTGEEGVPGGIVNSIVQSPDGFLWMATFAGLARFDGVHFKLFDPVNTPEMQSERIVHLALDRQGRVWTTSEFGHLTRFS